jgi:hypothetical protein
MDSSNIVIIASTISEATVFVLLGRIYELHHSDGLRGHDIHTKFHKDQFRCSKVVI